MASPPALAVQDLTVQLVRGGTSLVLVEGATFTVEPGTALGLVGESGSGKTVTLLALLDLLPGAVVTGTVHVNGECLLSAGSDDRARARGRRLATVFQDPLSSLHPMMTAGAQVEETLSAAGTTPPRERPARVLELLAEVGLPDPARAARSLPMQLSGGMRQRVQVAMALATGAPVLLADEPTTALDAITQHAVLDHLRGLLERRRLAMVLVSHDLAVVRRVAARVVVMYAGRVVEHGPVEEVVRAPLHPYTHALLGARPSLEGPRGPLPALPGTVPGPGQRPSGCAFQPRCPRADARCAVRPPMADDGRAAACVHPLEAL